MTRKQCHRDAIDPETLGVNIAIAATFGALLVILICLWMMARANARDNGQWAQTDPIVRAWFQAQIVPGGPHKGTSCCSSADGTTAEEDIRGGDYWARFQACDPVYLTSKCTQIDWMKVPKESVLDGPNKRGAAVVWWYYDSGLIRIRCYAPGAKT